MTFAQPVISLDLTISVAVLITVFVLVWQGGARLSNIQGEMRMLNVNLLNIQIEMKSHMEQEEDRFEGFRKAIHDGRDRHSALVSDVRVLQSKLGGA